jgi:hypothetical protein
LIKNWREKIYQREPKDRGSSNDGGIALLSFLALEKSLGEDGNDMI